MSSCMLHAYRLSPSQCTACHGMGHTPAPRASQIALSVPWRASAADQTFSVNRKYFIVSCICAQKQYVDLQLNLQLNLHLNLQHILFLRAYASNREIFYND